MASDLLNVQIQPGGGAIFKREGYGAFLTLPISCSTCAVHGGLHFQQVGGSDVQLWGNDTELAGSINDAAYVKLATGTVAATWQCADSGGFAYCLNSSRDSPVKTDGSTANTSYQLGIPLGTMLAFTPTQLTVAGVSGNENTIYISQQNAFTTFTIGVLPSSAFTEPIASPGSRITHLAYYFGKLFWWKDQSFGYATFTNQNDWQLTIVSNQIGTLDNSDAFWNSSGFDSGAKFTGTAQANAGQSPGGIFFRGQDNHFYVYDGYYLTRISRPITPTVTAAARRKASSWTQSSAADFNGGFAVNASTSFSPGDVTLGLFSDSFVSLSSWTTTSSTFTVKSNAVYQSTTPAISTTADMYSVSVPAMPNNWRMRATVQFSTTSLSGGTGCSILFSTGPTSSKGYGFSLTATSAIQTAAILGPDISNTSGSTVYGFNTSTHTLELSRTNLGAMTLYYDNVSTATSTDNTFTSFGNLRIQCTSPNPSSNILKVSGLTVEASTGTYYSAVNNAPNLTSWNTFNYTVQSNGGTHSFFVRSSTSAFTTVSSTPAWNAQTLGAVVSASTGTYFQAKDDFSINAATQIPAINDFTFNWYEGTASDKAFAVYYNDAIWFSVSSSTSASTNNRIFYWDLLNGAWLIFDIPANGFQIENNQLYFGDPVQGRIYKYGGTTADAGSPINSYWRSKSFYAPSTINPYSPPSFEDAFTQKSFEQADFILGESSTTLAYTYTLDSKTATTFNFTAYDSAASLIQRNFPLPPGKIGKYYDFQIGDNSSAQAWRMMGHRVHYNAEAWRPVLR